MAYTIGLQIKTRDGATKDGSYDSDSVLIGSGPSAVLQLEDQNVSSIHAVIKVTPDGEVTIIDLVGNLRTSDDYSRFRQAIDDTLDAGTTRVVLNFAQVTFINSSGLGRLVMAAKRAKESGGGVRIVSLSPELQELFAFTRLDSKIPTYASEAEAVKAFE